MYVRMHIVSIMYVCIEQCRPNSGHGQGHSNHPKVLIGRGLLSIQTETHGYGRRTFMVRTYGANIAVCASKGWT